MALLDPNVLAAAVTGAGVVVAAWISVGVKRRMGKEDAAAVGLAAQLGGWNTYTGHLQGRVTVLEERDVECQRRLAAVESENETLRAESAVLRERLAAIEQRLLPG